MRGGKVRSQGLKFGGVCRAESKIRLQKWVFLEKGALSWKKADENMRQSARGESENREVAVSEGWNGWI